MLVFLDTGVSKKYFAVARHPVTRFFIDLYENDIIYKEEIQDTIQKLLYYSPTISNSSIKKQNKQELHEKINSSKISKTIKKIITSILAFEN